MNKIYRTGAIGALLDEYEKAIADLQEILQDITDQELIKIADTTTTDLNCKSIQAILTHVVRSGYAYPIYIQNLNGPKIDNPKNLVHSSIHDYQKDMVDFFIFTAGIFSNIQEGQLEQLGSSKKIVTSRGQVYDIEQMMEHAIVHILRHRRQIEKFKLTLR